MTKAEKCDRGAGRKSSTRSFVPALMGGLLLTHCFLDIPAVKSERVEPGPVLFLSLAETKAIQQHLSDEPWKSAAEALAQQADASAGAPPRSVTDDGAPKNGDVHDFGTDSPGGTNPDRHDYLAGVEMATRTRELALSYAILGRSDHGARCIELLSHWFFDPATRVEPSAENAGPQTSGSSGSSIEIHLVVPPMLYAATLVWNHPAWNEKHPGAREGIVAWAKTHLAALEAQNFTAVGARSWWILARAAAAAFVESAASLAAAVLAWKTTLQQVSPEGYLLSPTTADLGSSLFALKPFVLTAEISRHHAGDLYAFTSDSGVGLQRMTDLYSGFLLDEGSWIGTGKLTSAERLENVGTWELLHSQYQTPSHLAVLSAPSPQRPIEEPRVLGPVTLTHGDAFRRGLSGSSP